MFEYSNGHRPLLPVFKTLFLKNKMLQIIALFNNDDDTNFRILKSFLKPNVPETLRCSITLTTQMFEYSNGHRPLLPAKIKVKV